MPESPPPTTMTSKCSGVMVLCWLNATFIFGSRHRRKLGLGSRRALRHAGDECRRTIGRRNHYHVSSPFNQLEIGARHFRSQFFAVQLRVEDAIVCAVE